MTVGNIYVIYYKDIVLRDRRVYYEIKDALIKG